MDSSTHVEVLFGVRAFDEFGDALDSLNARVGVPVTARRRWLSICAREQPDDVTIIAVRDAGSLVALAALATSRRRGVTRVVGVGHGVSDRFALPARDDRAAAELADAIVAVSTTWPRPWRLRIEQLPKGDIAARALSERMRVTEIRSADECPILQLDQGRDVEIYARSGLRKNVRAGRNRIVTDGRTLDVEIHTDPAAIEASLDRVRAVHRQRDHELGRPSDLDAPHGRRLWDSIVVDHARTGALEIVLLVIDGELAAYGVVLLDGAAYRVWDARINSRFARYAPGHLLGQAMLEASLAHDEITCFDWGRGTEPYKRLIADEVEERDDFVAWSSSLTRQMSEAPSRLRRRIAVSLARHPRMRRGWVWLKRHTVAR